MAMAAIVPRMNLSAASLSTQPPTFQSANKSSIIGIPKTGGGQEEALLSLTNKSSSFSSTGDRSLDYVYSLALDHCAAHNSLSLGKEIHGRIVKNSRACDLAFLGTKLLYMYGKCGSLFHAEKLFDEMPVKTIFTYNAMLGSYISNEMPGKAIELYSDMRSSDFPVDAHTCSCVLKACAEVQDMSCGSEIHGCHSIYAAELLFDGSGKGDVVLFNLMISMYASNGMSKEAMNVLVDVQNNGVVPTTYTFVAALQACEAERLWYGRQVHALILKYGLSFDRYVANAFVVLYAKCGRIDEAARVFDDIGDRDGISWNSMLDAYVQNGLYHDALDFFRGMTISGQQPDNVSVITALLACGRSGNLQNGMEIHAFAVKNGMELDLQVGNTIVDMYGKCSKPILMESAFRRMPEKDFISWATVIAGYVSKYSYVKALETFREAQAKGLDIDVMMIQSVLLACHGLKCSLIAKEIHGYIVRRQLSDVALLNTFVNVYGECREVNYARHVFELIDLKSVVSWTSIIACYVHNGLADEALRLCFLMARSGVEFDAVAVLSIISAAANLSALRKGKEVHGFLVRRCFHLEKFIASSLVDMYASCGAVDDSYKVFSYTKDRDLVLWTSMIDAYGMHGHGTMAIKLFREMENENLVPDHITFLALLYACSHSALVEEGKRYFYAMQCRYNLEPWPEHYACLVDLLSRANCLEEAFELVEAMEEPTPAVWCALLGACRTHSNMEIGEVAARKLLEMEPENPGNYVLISNLYAAAERWEDAEKVRVMMRVKGLRKDPGCSWIEVGNEVHTFTTQDRSHPRRGEIYEELNYITKKLGQVGGYKAQTIFVLHNVEEAEKVEMLHGHSERLALAYGLINTSPRMPIRIAKNLRVCGDCHAFTKLFSKVFDREVIVRDANRFHHFRDGVCSCGDFW
ncbi:pentatricopeptide repeat-containing protein At3g63370, chloroplastic isoform X2 [Andrographis paniculata]|uniref:pentatricopeptide repeat-containing protein At3g63370, chloroplastic isoform X2 n=1 Tax=Andrographis paniculata TaxID=175694 RepID=UPI0021E7C12A|nr:pentatricopeptide repeat-containing protein At3g63370, chloroplastic isoform X2 [Andrographis paniculata]